MTPAGFPHSDIRGSQDACSSPRLIAACHVLHRLSAPRHPPCALTALDQFRPMIAHPRACAATPEDDTANPQEHHHTPNRPHHYYHPGACFHFTRIVKKRSPHEHRGEQRKILFLQSPSSPPRACRHARELRRTPKLTVESSGVKPRSTAVRSAAGCSRCRSAQVFHTTEREVECRRSITAQEPALPGSAGAVLRAGVSGSIRGSTAVT